MVMPHIPVLLKETLEVLNPKKGEFIIDGTTDGGGHLEAVIEKMREGSVLAVDWDKDIIEATKERISARFGKSYPKLQIVWANDNYANVPEIVTREKLDKADGLLLDLGFSTEHLESKKGFSFKAVEKGGDEPLDMRYDRYGSDGMERATAAEVVNSLREEELADIIFKYGEERFSRQVAKGIVDARKKGKIITVAKLVEVIRSAVPKFFRKGEMDVVARTFQALRIYVNQELENVESILRSLTQIMNKGGRVAIISFHSLEDRLVKNYFKEMESKGIAKILTKKPIVPSEREVSDNPKSRSSKLRAIQIN